MHNDSVTSTQPAPPPPFGRATQSAIYLSGLAGRRPRIPTGWADLEAAARRAMSIRAFAYVAGSAGLEETERANRLAFDDWQIVPRVLRDVAALQGTA